MTKDDRKERSRPISLGLICAGGCGTNNAREVMRALPSEKHPHLWILVCNTDRPQLDNHFVISEEEPQSPEQRRLQDWIRSDQLTVIQLGESGMGAGGKPEEGAAAAQSRLPDIESFLAKVDAAILIGGGGKGTGSGALPVIAEAAKKAGKSPLCILTMPRFNEGGRRLKKANDCRQKLLAICPTAVIYNQQLPDTSLTYTEVWSRINQACLLPMLLVLQEIILEVADLNVDLNDWRVILEAGNFVQFGRCEVESDGSGDFSQVVNQLLSNPYQDCRIMTKAREILVWLHGQWTVEEHDQLINQIQKSMEKNIRDDEIEVNPGLFQSAKDGQKWAAILVVASEEPAEAAPSPSFSEKRSVAAPENVTVMARPAQAAQTAEITCVVSGRSKVLRVTPSLAKRWSRLFSSDLVKAEEAACLINEIRAETGEVPELPRTMNANAQRAHGERTR